MSISCLSSYIVEVAPDEVDEFIAALQDFRDNAPHRGTVTLSNTGRGEAEKSENNSGKRVTAGLELTFVMYDPDRGEDTDDIEDEGDDATNETEVVTEDVAANDIEQAEIIAAIRLLQRAGFDVSING